MTNTPNLNLDLWEASDIFNPMGTNGNFETLDTVISDIQKKGGIVTYTTTASANLLKLSGNPTPNDTVFKFVAAGDANTWSYQEAVNNIVALDGKQKTVKAGVMYVAWVNAANAMVVVAWPDVVNAQTFDGKGPAEWASKVQLDAVNQTAANATQTAQAAATVANNALEKAEAAGLTIDLLWTNPNYNEMSGGTTFYTGDLSKYKALYLDIMSVADSSLILQPLYVVMPVSRTLDIMVSTAVAPNWGVGSDGIAERQYQFSGTEAKIGVYSFSTSSISPISKLLVPYRLYGIK